MTDTPIFQSREFTPEPEWIDINGHLNVAYYGVIFDKAADEALLEAGLGEDYQTTRNRTFMAAEAHSRYLREVLPDQRVAVRVYFMGVDDKRLHIFAEMLNISNDRTIVATWECLFLSVDLSTRRVAPWPSDVQTSLHDLVALTAHLPPPAGCGRRIERLMGVKNGARSRR